MDERSEKALDFANYLTTLGNANNATSKQRVQVLQTVHYKKVYFLQIHKLLVL